MQDSSPIKIPEKTILNNRYVILRFLGEGGLAYNYLAHPLNNPSKKVVIKQTKRFVELTDKISEDRFQMEREFRMLQELEDPRIPPALEMFELNKVLYFAREYREGELLDSIIANGIRRSRIYDISIEILRVLEYLHKRGIVYRDLKPSNILVDDENRISLFDFGTARFFKEGQKTDTIILGTPGFAAPEQYGKSQSSEASDIYSFGALLYYMITGDNPEDNPFKFGEEANIRSKIDNEFLADLLVRCLALNPRNRFKTVRELHLKMLRVRFFAREKNRKFSEESPAQESSVSPRSCLGSIFSFDHTAKDRMILAVVLSLFGLVLGAACVHYFRSAEPFKTIWEFLHFITLTVVRAAAFLF